MKKDSRAGRLLGKEITVVNSNPMRSPIRVYVAHIDPEVGITLVDCENGPDSRACISRRYFGANFPAAFFEAVRMIEDGILYHSIIDAYALDPMGAYIPIDGLDPLPQCPFEAL